MDKEKRYNDALERAREALLTSTAHEMFIIESIFPKLKESEEDKIRKAIHIYLDWLDGRKDCAPKGIYTIRDMIAWLEKQNQVKDSFISQHEIETRKENDDSLTSEDEKIRQDIKLYLRNEKIVKRYISDIEIDKWIAWLEKQKPNTNKREIDDAYLQGMADAKHEIEKQGELNNNDTDILNRFSFYSYKDEPNILYLSELYVNKEQRNKGIGTKILKIADEVAANMKCNSIRLKTEIGSNAERLYRKNGYNSLKMEGNHIWLEKQGERELENYDEAEKEKADFVGDGFIECHTDFLDFKEGKTYWLEYIGDDKYNVRSDNLLGKTYHITPCQLYTVFKKQTWIKKPGKKLDPEEVIEWLKTKVYGNSTYGVKMIEQFKKDLGL